MRKSDDYDNVYMKDERSKSVEGFIAALEIFSKYLKDGMKETFFFGAGHDILYIWVENDAVNEEEAITLSRLGWHPSSDGGSWAYFT